MSTSTQARAAKVIRDHLKANGIEARVKSRSASMMTAIDVYVTDQPPWVMRELEAYVGQFEYGHFDGYDDCYRYSNRRDDLPQVKFAHVNNPASDNMIAEINAWIASYYAPGHEPTVWQVYGDDKMWGRAFWSARKARLVA